jgi:hypothetical protein
MVADWMKPQQTIHKVDINITESFARTSNPTGGQIILLRIFGEMLWCAQFLNYSPIALIV